ncbi:MAG TPA: IS1595 family transposase [Dehalococcoidia bacterium]|nr:IS1595 family transposase [Dehalococcoidia bacterium]
MEFVKAFPDDAACLEWLWRKRYSDDGEHAYCPKCETERSFKRYETTQQRQSWTCTTCAHRLHPTAGTIYHKSSTSLHLWFYAMYLMASTRCGISAKQIERELGVTYKTAWRMAYLIRNELMEQDDITLSGEVEADEAWIGGRPRYRRGEMPRGPDGKGMRGPRPKTHPTQQQAVFGMVERQGRVIVKTIPNVQSATLLPHIQQRVLPASTIYTDEWRSYNKLGKQGYVHKRIAHKERVYVSGDVHTQTIEGFWSLTKNGIRGVYHAVSAKHLQGYLNEYAWRYNERHSPKAMFETLLLRSAARN